MPKLPSSLFIEQVLQKEGFSFVRQKGSHQRYAHEDGRKVTITANKKEIPVSTVRSIARQARLDIGLFLYK